MLIKSIHRQVQRTHLNSLKQMATRNKPNPSPLKPDQLNDLDQQIKEKILHQEESQSFDFDKEKFKDGLKSAYMLMTQEMYHDKKTVTSFKQQIILQEEDPLKRGQQAEENSQDALIQQYMNTGTQEQQLAKLQRARNSVRDEKHWDIEEDRQQHDTQQYGHYDKFNGFWAGQKDKAYDSEDDLPGTAIGKTFKQMADKLMKEEGVQFIEHNRNVQLDRELRNQSIEGRPMDADLLREEDIATQQFEGQYQEYMDEIDFTKISYDIFGEQDESDQEANQTNPFVGRLSPTAKETIFQLVNKGESIKNISERFGILPERIKVIVWQKKTFYDEVLPRLSLTTVRLALQAEDIYNSEYGFQEYGIDLNRLLDREKGMHMKHFLFDAVDVKKSKTEEVRKKMAELMKSKKKKKYELVQEKFVGEAHKGYFIKEWKWYRGKGTDRMSRIFQRTLKHSHQQYRLPLKVQEKLKEGKGPREACYGTRHVSR